PPPSSNAPTTAPPSAPVPPVTTARRPRKSLAMEYTPAAEGYRPARPPEPALTRVPMPIYEYRCEQDGSVIELLRPMADADKPVEDPDGKGRVFQRQHSTFAPGGSAAGQ